MSKNLLESINNLGRFTKTLKEADESSITGAIESYYKSVPDYGIPSFEEIQEYADFSEKDYEIIKSELEKLTNLPHYNGMLELSDNHTLNTLGDRVGDISESDSELLLDIYNTQLQVAFDSFEENTGVECYTEGRMGRHICVEDTYQNASRFEELQSIQREMESTLIDTVVEEFKNEVGEPDEDVNEEEIPVPISPEEACGTENPEAQITESESSKYRCIKGMSHPNMGRMFKKGQVYELSADKGDEITLGGFNISKKYLDTHFEKIDESEKLEEQDPIAFYIEEIGFNPYEVDYSQNADAEEIINTFKQADKLESLFNYIAAGLSEPFEDEDDYLNYVAGTDIEDYETYNGPLNEKALKEQVLADGTESEIRTLIADIKALADTIKHTVEDEMISINARIERINEANELLLDRIETDAVYTNLSDVIKDMEYELKNSEWSKEDAQEESENLTENDSSKTFEQWFDETYPETHVKDDKFYPFSNYVKTFTNAACLKDLTAQDVIDNIYNFDEVYPVDSDDRSQAFAFASEVLGIDREKLDDAYYDDKLLDESNNLTEDEKQIYNIDIYQIDNIDKVDYAFMDWDHAANKFSMEDYKKVDTYEIEASDVNIALEKAYSRGNLGSSRNYRSISVSDVLIVDSKAYYTDSIGFQEIPNDKMNESLKEEIKHYESGEEDRGVEISVDNSDKVYLVYSDNTILVSPNINNVDEGGSEKFDSTDEMIKYFREHKADYADMDVYEEASSDNGETFYVLSDANEI